MKTVSQVSRISGVSVRTLRYYDSIGLLKPAAVSESGYRLYDDNALIRLRSIMFFRELGFSLGEIKEIVLKDDFDAQKALSGQIKLLEKQKERTERLIALARSISEKGNDVMDFSPFDGKRNEEYEKEAEKRWRDTAEYKESKKREEKRSDAESSLIADGLMKIFVRFSEIKNTPPEGEEAQKLAEELRKYISDNYYPCTKEILCSLGQMYVTDERFRKNIDGYASEGTAEYVSKATEIYSK